MTTKTAAVPNIPVPVVNDWLHFIAKDGSHRLAVVTEVPNDTLNPTLNVNMSSGWVIVANVPHDHNATAPGTWHWQLEE